MAPESGLDVITACRKCIAQAFFPNTSRKLTSGEGYKTYAAEASLNPTLAMSVLYLHPTSALKEMQPKWVVYDEVVYTTKPFIKGVCTIDFEWVQDLLPKLKNANVRQLIGQSGTEKLHSDTVARLHAAQEAAVAATATGAPTKAGARVRKQAPEAKKSEGDVQSAKARYLARKAGKASSKGK